MIIKVPNHYLCFSDFKHLIISVDDGRGRSAAADETYSLCVSGEFDGALSGHGIRWVEHSRCRDGTEHRKILKSHLRRTVLSCTQQNNSGVKNKIQMFMYPWRVEVISRHWVISPNKEGPFQCIIMGLRNKFQRKYFWFCAIVKSHPASDHLKLE